MSKLHLDVDPGCDDAIMIALALMDPAVEVVGMSTVGGNSTVENTTHNALAILELFDRTDVPVARGADAPINGSFQQSGFTARTDSVVTCPNRPQGRSTGTVPRSSSSRPGPTATTSRLRPSHR
jgi:inosine-uridine nucleoside N-ribohydrolase